MSHRRKEEDRKPRPWESDHAGGADSFGDWLRRQREMRDIGLREVSDTTKINLRYLQALEENRFSALPAPVFARGFLREYARYVGLDPDEVVNYYDAAQQEQQPENEDGPRARRPRSSNQWVYGLVLTLAVLGLFGVVAAMSFWAERRPAPDELPPIAPPVFEPAPPAPVAEAAAAPLEVTLDFSENSWVEATLDDRDRVSELRVQGESLRLTAKERVLLTLGNAPGVHIEVNGKPFEIASTDETVRDLEITLASIGGGEEAIVDGAAPATAAGVVAPGASPQAAAAPASRAAQTPVRRAKSSTAPGGARSPRAAPTAVPQAPPAAPPEADSAAAAASEVTSPAAEGAALEAEPAVAAPAEPLPAPETVVDATPEPPRDASAASGRRPTKTPKPKATPKKTPRRARGDGGR